VVTAKAKSKIRDYFKQERNQSVTMGKEILERKFKNAKIPFSSEALNNIIKFYKLSSVTELYYQLVTEKIDRTKIDLTAILEGETKKQTQSEEQKLVKKPTKPLTKDAVIIGDGDPVEYAFAKCCSPIPGDDIFVSYGVTDLIPSSPLGITASSTNLSQYLADIVNAINTDSGTTGFSAWQNGSNINIQSPPGSTFNGTSRKFVDRSH
jgi:GTP pyrophosphokinase